MPGRVTSMVFGSSTLILVACLALAASATVVVEDPAAVTKLTCRRGTCFSSMPLHAQNEERLKHRKLQQWGGGGCANKPLVIVHGSNIPTNIDPLINDMESPLTKVDVVTRGGQEGKEKFVDPARVELISLTAPDSCIRNLNTVQGGLVIWDDGSIPNLSALSNLRTVVGPLFVYGLPNATLTNLDGLNNLQQVSDLNLAHTKLQNINALSKVVQIQGDLVVLDNPQLESLSGLGPVDQLYDAMWIDNNPRIQDLMGLDNIHTIFGDIEIRNMPSLKSLNGLGALTGIGGELSMINIPQLASTSALSNLTKIGISLVIMEAGSLEDLSGFSKIASLPGDLQLYLLPNLPSLRDLANLQAVGLNLVVGENAKLTSLQGLDNLRSVGTLLSVSWNAQLQSLKGLGNLQSIGQDLFIRGNPALTTLDDLGKSLRSIGAFRGGDVFIESNGALKTLGSVASQNFPVYGYVTVQGNAVPDSEVAALKSRSQPFGMSIEALQNGLPSNLSRPAAVAAAPAAAAAAPAAAVAVPNATVGAAMVAAPNASTPAAAALPAVVAAVPAAAVPTANNTAAATLPAGARTG